MLTTNGTLLPAKGEMLLAERPYKVNVSLHSFEEGSEEEFLRYVDGVIDFADAASRAGVIVVLRLWNRGGEEGLNDAVLNRLRSRLDGEWRENTRGFRVRERLHLEWGDRFEWPDMEAPDGGDRVFCYGLSDHFGILCDGRVVPCCLDSDGVITLGNVFEEPLRDILNTERACAMREGFAVRHASEELCRRCGYARRFK